MPNKTFYAQESDLALLDEAANLARQEGTSLSQLIITALADHLAKENPGGIVAYTGEVRKLRVSPGRFLTDLYLEQLDNVDPADITPSVRVHRHDGGVTAVGTSPDGSLVKCTRRRHYHCFTDVNEFRAAMETRLGEFVRDETDRCLPTDFSDICGSNDFATKQWTHQRFSEWLAAGLLAGPDDNGRYVITDRVPAWWASKVPAPTCTEADKARWAADIEVFMAFPLVLVDPS